jgi:hypothetical protein
MGEKYRTKTLLVTGKYVDAKVEKSDYTFVKLQGSGKVAIICEVTPSQKEAMAALKAGETVRFACQYGYTESDHVRLSTCWPVTIKK